MSFIGDAIGPETIAYLRSSLAHASDEGLAGFINNYSLATVAAHLIAQMSPLARAGFFATMRQQYAEARDLGGGS